MCNATVKLSNNLRLIRIQEITMYLSNLIKRDSNEYTNTEMNSTDWAPNFTDDRYSVEVNISTSL